MEKTIYARIWEMLKAKPELQYDSLTAYMFDAVRKRYENNKYFHSSETQKIYEYVVYDRQKIANDIIESELTEKPNWKKVANLEKLDLKFLKLIINNRNHFFPL